MDKINTWERYGNWTAYRHFAITDKDSYYSTITVGTGKTKEDAISSLCDALMTLSEEINVVVHEVSVNSRPDILINYEKTRR